MADVRGGGSDPLARIEDFLTHGPRWEGSWRADSLEAVDEICAELAALRGRLAETERHAGMDVTNERIMEAHSAMLAEWLAHSPDKLHFAYKQGHDERCYICVLVARAEALRVERDTAVDALRRIAAGAESNPASEIARLAQQALAAVGQSA